MAVFKPYKVLSSQLSSLPIKEGQFIITTDTNQIFVDLSSSIRQEYALQGNKTVISETEPSGINEGDIWMILETN